MRLAVFLLPLAMASAANYSVQKISVEGHEVVELADAARKTTVRVVPSIGNNAYEMKVNGTNILFSPYQTLADWKAKPTLLGVPFLGPWANRLDSDGFWANGKRYQLNPELKNFNRAQAGKPIHGLLQYASEWKVTRTNADDRSASVTSKLEFWRFPDRMAQFPFAHNLEMTYTLRDGALDVTLAVENLAEAAMPVSLAFHPYFTLNDAPRDEWTVTLPARERYELDESLVATGATKPNPYKSPLLLRDVALDDVFGALETANAEFVMKGKQQQIAVRFSPQYPVAVVYAPKGRNFVCFEPMTGPTNAFNLAHDSRYKNLQSVPPGQTWRASFQIVPSGF
jgi:aldose 1-epimerase